MLNVKKERVETRDAAILNYRINLIRPDNHRYTCDYMRSFTTLHCCNTAYLQHGGNNYWRML